MEQELRRQLLQLLEGKGAHADFASAIQGIPAKFRGAIFENLPYSIWQLLEHMRLSQFDILDYIRNSDYESKKWPDDYWPKSPKPPKASSWKESIERFQLDVQKAKDIVEDCNTDLYAQIPHGKKGHTILREILLIADHNAYHIGQIVLMRRLFKIWE